MCTARIATAAPTSTTPRTACARCCGMSIRPTRRSAWSRSRRSSDAIDARLRRAPQHGDQATTATTRATRGYVTDTINEQLQARRRRARTRPRASTCTPCRGRHGLVHPVRRLHVVQRGAAPGQGRARLARPRQRPRLHRLPDRRRGQHRQRLRPDTSTRRATPTISSPARPRSTSRTPTRRRARRSTASATRSARTRSARPAIRKRSRPNTTRRASSSSPHARAIPISTAPARTRRTTTTESPTIYSDDTVEDIASAGGFYNKSSRRRPQHDLRRDRDRHRIRLESIGGRWLLSSTSGASAARRSSS